MPNFNAMYQGLTGDIGFTPAGPNMSSAPFVSGAGPIPVASNAIAAAPPPPPPAAPMQSTAADASFIGPPAPPHQASAPPLQSGPTSMEADRENGAVPGLVNFGRTAYTPGLPAREVQVVGPTAQRIDAGNYAVQGQIANDIMQRSVEAQENAGLHAAIDASAAQAYREEKARKQAEHDQLLEMQRQEYRDAVDDLAAKGTLDPDRLYNSKTTPEKIAQHSLVLLGAVFGGLAGQENKALAAVQRAQDQDIAAQKFAYQAGLDQAAGRNTAFRQMMDRFGSPEAAEAAVRAAQLDVQIANAQIAKSKASTVEEANNYDKFIQGLDNQKAEQQRRYLAYMQPTGGGARHEIINSRGQRIWVSDAERNKYFEKGLGTEEKYGVTATEVDAKRDVAAMEHAGKADAKFKDIQGRWVPVTGNSGYLAPTEEEGKKHRETLAATEKTLDLVRRIREQSKDVGTAQRIWYGATPAGNAASALGLESDSAKAVTSNTQALLGALKEADKLGALDKGSQEVLGKMIGNPLSVVGNEANLAEIERNARQTRQQHERSITGSRPAVAPPGARPRK